MVGRTVGHYRIVERIGQGGVGQVYRAEDLRLDRNVAVKMLSQPSPKPDQVARFEREAKAAAALDHPNILAIHEFGHDGAMPYVVMELLDGCNLRQRLGDGALPVRTAIDYALDIVNGLAAAHEKGICHRDLKPENIFITNDGRVKILDFGLANVRAPEGSLTAGDGVTREALTLPGVIVGTPSYMAPEQVRGERGDDRADIFAVGLVLFEMLTGHRAFYGPTAIETFTAILHADAPLHLLDQRAVPPALVAIVGRCLNKRPDERFRSVRDVHSALRGAQATVAVETPSSARAGQNRLDSWKEIAAYLGRGVRTVQRWEREEQLPIRRLPHAKRGSVYANREEVARWWESRQTGLSETPTPKVEESRPASGFERVTNTSAMTFSPSLSSDGRMLVFVSDGGEDDALPQVWLQQVGGAALRLTTEQRDCAEPTFSADDTLVLFTAKADRSLNVYAVPTLGGPPRLLRRNARSARMSPDGRWLAYVSLDSARGFQLGTREGTGDRTVAADLTDISCVVWSPDSAYVLVGAHQDSRFEPDYWVVPIDGRPPIDTRIMGRFRSQGTVLDMPPVWVRDFLVLTVGGRNGAILWRQRLAPQTFQAADEPEPITRGTEWAHYPAAAGSRLAFVSAHADMNLWSLAIDASGMTNGPPRRLTRGPGVLGHLSITADGRTLAYFSARTGMPSVFIRDLESGSETVLGGPPPKGFPAISPSGARLAHGALAPGPRAMRPVFIVDLPGGTSRQLSEDCGGRPRLWLDDDSILVETFGSRLKAFIVVDATTGSVRPLLSSLDRSLSNPCLSPDSRWIAFDAATPGGSPAVFFAPIDRSAPVPESDWIMVDDGASHPFWSRDGRLLYYLPATPNLALRRVIRARPVDATSRRPEADSFVVAVLKEGLIPTLVPGTTPIATSNEITLALGDFRGDIWMTEI